MKNIQNATQNQEKAQNALDIVVENIAGKEWEAPSITEISRFSILGGVTTVKAEGTTFDGSA